LGQGEFAFEKSCGGGDRIGRDCRENEAPFLFSELDFAPGLQPKLLPQLLGNQDLALSRELCDSHGTMLPF
jgi:hypothetical protein